MMSKNNDEERKCKICGKTIVGKNKTPAHPSVSEILCSRAFVGTLSYKSLHSAYHSEDSPINKDAIFDTNRKSLLRHISAEKGLK